MLLVHLAQMHIYIPIAQDIYFFQAVTTQLGAYPIAFVGLQTP